MTLNEAIKTLDEVIPPPQNKMVDMAHLNIAIAWQTIKAELEKPCIEAADYEPITHFFED